MRAVSTLSLLTGAVAAQSIAKPYDQCGGIGWTNPAACPPGYFCTTYNPYYAQCYPGTATATLTSSSTSSSTSVVTTPNSPITTTLSTITTSPTPTAPNPVPTTLVPSHYWARAVAPPNYHLYLQPSTSLSPGPAVLATGLSAAQFTLSASDGQLVLYRGASAPPLYLNVEPPAETNQRTLATKFKESKNGHGKFGFQGDTLTWSVAGTTRPNEAAWLVCGEGKDVFVNMGAYGYQTPEGCADQTIHSYGGSTADY